MKILANWLNDYLSTKVDAKEAAVRLEKAGVEIEQIISSKAIDRNIKVACVKKVIQHPNADRLKLVDVDTGTEIIQVVCGAPNVVNGQLVALANPGAKLPDGTVIEKTLIRGENSEGMLCSPRELGLSDDHEGILVLDSGLKLGTTLCDIVNSDEILDLTTAANRPDLLSAVGLAREVAAQGGEAALEPVIEGREFAVDQGMVGKVEPNVVKKYLLAHVKLNGNGESPQWLKQRLSASGLRPVNSVVDITNYVMLELGQPLHAFDATEIKLPISVHSPRDGTVLTTLDGNDHPLSPIDLVINDQNGPIALAGVMGGQSSQITSKTTEVYLEAACFDGATVRRMATRHGLRTDASARFERNLPLPLAGLALRRAIELLEELCGASSVVVSSMEPPLSPAGTLKVSLPTINRLLGIEVSSQTAAKALSNLGFDVSFENDSLMLALPWWRTDVLAEADIVEELGRTLGYDSLPATLPAWTPTEVEFDRYWPQLWKLKAALRGLGLDEVVTYSFVSLKQLEDFGHDTSKHLKLKNPLSVEQAYLRSSLAPSLVATVARNARLFQNFGIYEISKVYVATENHAEQPEEPVRLGVMWRAEAPYKKIKTVLDTLSREFAQFEVNPKPNPTLNSSKSAQIMLDDHPIGWIGEINKTILNHHKITGAVGYLEIDLMPWLVHAKPKKAAAISRFPVITRDLAIVVNNDILWSNIAQVVQISNTGTVEYLNDYYGDELPQGTKSVALRLTFGSTERTLTDEEADTMAAKVMDTLAKELGASQRG